jgi:hypothetical protein
VQDAKPFLVVEFLALFDHQVLRLLVPGINLRDYHASATANGIATANVVVDVTALAHRVTQHEALVLSLCMVVLRVVGRVIYLL